MSLARWTPTRRIEDYEALIAPYRPLLAEVASLEVLDELLRLLYEGGDAPSVVGWPGKMSDCEYRNLKEHKHFLEILQKRFPLRPHVQCSEGRPRHCT